MAQPAQAEPDKAQRDSQTQPQQPPNQAPEDSAPDQRQQQEQTPAEPQLQTSEQQPQQDSNQSHPPQEPSGAPVDGENALPGADQMNQLMMDPNSLNQDMNGMGPGMMGLGAATMQPQAVSGMDMDPNVMMMIMANQGALTDPSMVGFPMANGPMMMPMMMPGGSMPMVPQGAVSEDDIARYDRQIRLWGIAAQGLIQKANVLLITIRALGNEIAKNLVLAGVGSLTILDDATVTEADLGAQFFLSDAEADGNIIGQNRAEVASTALRKLNPSVGVFVDTEGAKAKGPSYFGLYDIVIATDLDPASNNLINTATRLNNRKFYAAGSHGMYGFIFSDLIEHDFAIERETSNIATQPGEETRTRSVTKVETRDADSGAGKKIESVSKRELYSTWGLASDFAKLPQDYLSSRRRLRAVTPALTCLRAIWEFMQLQGGRLPSNRNDLKLFTQIATQKHKDLSLPSETLRPDLLRSFLQNLGSEISPVVAVLGGQLAQDVINVLSCSQQPIQNMVIFDGNSMEALMYPLHPEGVLGRQQLESMAGGGGSGGNVGGDFMNGGAGSNGMDIGQGGMPSDNVHMGAGAAGGDMTQAASAS